ncbi:MAG: hypothetical protein Cons2KO_18270 [Congregibacter sp.]
MRALRHLDLRRDFSVRHLILALVVLAISGCGFQLRGTGGGSALPEAWKSMHLIADNANSELTRIVEASFSANGVVWLPRGEAAYILRLGNEQFSQRNLSVNAEARAAEFDLQMRADFIVMDRDGQVLMERTTGAVNKQMENDPQNVVGKAEEIRVLRGELRFELAQQIFRRISFFAANNG